MRDLFLLDPDIVFLNHGSFGACPRPVLDEYQRWQREIERRPVELLDRRRRFTDLLAAARLRLAEYVGADPEGLVFVPNATSGINAVARSLALSPGDEVLATDHEYGALDLTWRVVCERAGARYVRVPVPSPESAAESLFAAVTPRTRAFFVSHLTSTTALRLPIEELCRRARAAGILTIVDGAHGPGQLPLDLEPLGADVYAGNCHKWLCAPKGSGFLSVRADHRGWVDPPVVSWDWDAADFAARWRWQGTRDPAAFLTVPAAIDFQREHDWDTVRARCHALAEEARVRLAELFGLAPLAPDGRWLGQMVAAPLPPCDVALVKRRLYEEHRIEVPVLEWNGRPLVRVSFQAYNDAGDLERLLEALPAAL